jgi:formylmethanofuran dehydrogenase subunit E
MFRPIAIICLCGFSSFCYSADQIENLPQPHYHQQATDPAWMKYAVQLHGHLGPMLTFGARMGMASLQAVDAKGYFDVEVTCEGPFVQPPESCFLDGIQISTGATMGKRNLHWIESNEIVIRVKNVRSKKSVEIRPKESFLAILPRMTKAKNDQDKKAQNSHTADEHALDELARKMAAMPEEDIVTIVYPQK